VRGVRAAPDLADRIVVTAGATEGLRALAAVLAGPGGPPIAVEEWGLHVHRRMLDRVGPATVPLAVDDHGARTDLLGQGPTAGARAAVLTPAHQYPVGVPLDPGRRSAAVAWAREVDGIVVEDDYDGEFRYDRRPVGALHGLGPDRVAYVGTASKALAPGLRLGWLVLPRRLVGPVRAGVTGGCGIVDQLALADLISSGAYDRHVRAARRRHRRRREELAAVLATRAPGARLVGHPAGLHVLVELPAGTEGPALAEAARRGVAVQGLGGFRHPDAPSPARDGLVVGYAGPSESAWPGALTALADLLAVVAG
jgi:GntR family transcriptional regulator / MocR family aminotransferase